jgi:hypothetical protein
MRAETAGETNQSLSADFVTPTAPARMNVTNSAAGRRAAGTR